MRRSVYDGSSLRVIAHGSAKRQSARSAPRDAGGGEDSWRAANMLRERPSDCSILLALMPSALAGEPAGVIA